MTPPREPGALKPAFETDNVAVVFASDINYMPYLATTLRSVIDHCSPNHNYDLLVLSEDIPPREQLQIQGLSGGAGNISLRFIDVSPLVEKKAGDFFTSAHISVASYYRLFSPSIFAAYPRILYLDVDLAVLADVAELFYTDLEGAVAGAARDYLGIKDLPRKRYARWRAQLGLRDINDYFNAGVLLLDLDLLRAEGFEQKWFELLVRLKRPRVHDQDILNSSCEGRRVKLLDPAWNCLAWAEACGEAIFSRELPGWLYQEYAASARSPRIIHYLTRHKPWQLPHLELADIFWRLALRTPYGQRLMFDNLRQLNAENDIFKARLRLPPSRLKALFYKFMSLVTFGRTGFKYRAKALKSRTMNRSLKSVLRSWH